MTFRKTPTQQHHSRYRTRNMRIFIHPIAFLATLLSATANPANGALDIERRPNIIVFYTDDHGHADLSCQRVVTDIRTPNVDALAKSGVLARHGYSTAPQCVPSRAGLMVGKFQ
ncbi:MAG: sulfatase-like hydrolase/transferase, partial [Planctomycetota bacterium]